MEIRLHEVCKSFEGRAVLQKLNWTLASGALWRLSGASGIGKTTLLRLLMGLETPDSGTITGTGGVRISVCFQEHRLCDWLTARQNVRLVCGAETAEDILGAALLRLLPPDALDRPAGTLSGGMQRRVALARALLPPSELVLLDEPFAGLDADSIARALEFITDYRQGRALVLVSHEGHAPQEAYETLKL